MRLQLRPYQQDALARVNARLGEGVRRQLGVAATGLGKTVVFCALAEQLGLRTLILAHRDELINQAVKEIIQLWPDLPSIGVVKGKENQVHAQIVVGSVQTISRPNRLARLCPQFDPFTDPEPGLGGRPFGLIVIDEAHHAASASYKRILDWCGTGLPGGPILYGTTATPQRGDGQGLDGVFDEIVFNYDILWGIRAGYLSDVRGQRVKVEALDLSRVKISRGDYQVGDTGRALHEAGAPWVIAQAIREYAPHRLTLAFLPTVATAEETAEACRRVGLRAGCISDGTPKNERRNLLDRFRRHEVDVVANCMVLTEGFNAPRTDCIVIGRMTKSSGLYTQMIGRGTRRHPDKEDCLVLDVVGASRENTLVTLPSLFGIPKRLAAAARDGSVTVSDLVAQHEDTEIRAGRLEAEAADLFRRLRTAGLAWVTAPRRDDARLRYVLELGNFKAASRLVMMQSDPDDEESWAVQEQHPDPAVGNRTLIRDVDLETCQGVGEDYARIHGDGRLTDPTARWRARPPKPRQVAAARKWHLPNLDQYTTAGELSDALTAHIEKRRRRTARPAS